MNWQRGRKGPSGVYLAIRCSSGKLMITLNLHQDILDIEFWIFSVKKHLAKENRQHKFMT